MTTIPGTRSQDSTEDIVRRVFETMLQPLKRTPADEDSQAVIGCINVPHIDRTKIAMSHTDVRPEPYDAIGNRMKMMKGECKIFTLILQSVSDSMKRTLVRRVKVIIKAILSKSSELQHCRPNVMEGSGNRGAHNHVDLHDEDWCTVSYVCEHIMELFEGSLYDETEQEVFWSLKPEFARRIQTSLNELDSVDSDDPRDPTDFVCQSVRGEEWDGPSHKESALTEQEDKTIDTIVKAYDGQ